jgi:hypothetical protein
MVVNILQWFMAAALLLPFGVASAATSNSVNVPITITATPSGSDEEFVGPFASWVCARTQASGTCGAAAASFCNAAGNGSADDTTAIQNCINRLSSGKPVIYFPCGTYNISTTLNLSNQVYVSLIGQDNSTAAGRCRTTLKWTGSSGGKLLYINGVYASQFTRLTFDGNNLVHIVVDQSWDGSTGSFDASNQYIDDVFKNGNDNTTSYGYRCGALAAGCSEVNLVRDTFSEVGFGVATCNADALDVGVWYSSFSNTKIAVGNSTGEVSCYGGAPHAIGDVFRQSSKDDIYISGGGDTTNNLDNYSFGSKQFAYDLGVGAFQRNTIMNTNLDGTAAGASIFSSFALVLDNTIENTNTTGPYVGASTITSIGNKFTGSMPISYNNRLYESGDQTISPSTINPPALPGAPPNNNRTIYEASTLGLQTAICKASNGASSTFSAGACTGSPDSLKNVAHLVAGTYTPSSAIVVPANSNAQIIGDGWDSVVSSTTANPVMAISGPSQVTLRGFRMFGTYTSPSNDGIHISGVDQANAYVYLRGERLGSNSTASLVLSGLTNVLVDADDFQYPYNTGTYDIIQSGSSHFNQFFGTGGSRSVSGDANQQMIGGWLEAASFLPQSSISGTGSFIHSTAHLGAPANTNYFNLSNFTGTFALLNSPVNPNSCPSAGYAVNATGVGTGGLIISGLDFFPDASPISNSAGSTMKVFGNDASQCIPIQIVPDIPSPITSTDLSAVATALQYFRNTKPLVPTGNSPGTSAVELYDVFVEGFATAVRITQ